jgi:hypothetical protein
VVMVGALERGKKKAEVVSSVARGQARRTKDYHPHARQSQCFCFN